MDQYPKWFLALNFPNVLIALVTMIFFMFGGVHPFGDVDNMFWSFIIYIFTQLFWLLPLALFFISVLSWGWAREKVALWVAGAGWAINLAALYILFAA